MSSPHSSNHPPPIPVRPRHQSLSTSHNSANSDTITHNDTTQLNSTNNNDLASFYGIQPESSPMIPARSDSNSTNDTLLRTHSVNSTSGSIISSTPLIDRKDNSVQLKDISNLFIESHFDLTQPNWRTLIKSGELSREINKLTREQHSRHAFLFNDIIILSKPAQHDINKLVMKQVIDLRDMTVENVAIKNSKRLNQFILHCADNTDLIFNALNENDKYDWIAAIEATIQIWKQHSKSRTTERHERTMSSTELFEHKLNTMTLSTAISQHDDEILMHMLSERNDDPNTIDSDGNTMLHTAVLANNSQAVMFLLSHGAHINSVNNNTGNTPLHVACAKHEYGIAMLLCGKRADLNIKNNDGHTPLWLLCCTDNSNIDIFRSVGFTPQHIDNDNDSTDDDSENIANNSSNGLSVDQGRHKFIDLVKLMNESGADAELFDPHTNLTLLQTLVKQNKTIAIQSLVECHLSLNTIDTLGRTALHFAVSTNSLQSVKLLLSLGAGPNIRDHQSNTPLHLARTLSIAVCLIMNGARIDLINITKTRAAQFFETIVDEVELRSAQLAIRDAVESWNERTDTYNDGELVDDSNNKYIDDTLSDVCLLCNAQFGITVRRHHCKRCGILCCWYCSTKQYTMRNKSIDTNKYRCCDPCYNIMSHKSKSIDKLLRQQRIRQSNNDNAYKQLQLDKQLQQAELDRKKYESEQRINARRELLQQQKNQLQDKYTISTSNDTTNNKPQRQQSILSAASNMSSLMSDSKNLLHERGEKLDELQDKSEQLENDSQNFASLAKKLADKQKRPLGFLGL